MVVEASGLGGTGGATAGESGVRTWIYSCE